MVSSLSTALASLATDRYVPAPAPVVAIRALAEAVRDAQAGGGDALAARRRAGAARRVAALALDLAATIHGAFGDRPDGPGARARALEIVRYAAARPGLPMASALEELEAAVRDLAGVADEAEWQLAAIAFTEEAALRRLHERCVALAAAAVRQSAA